MNQDNGATAMLLIIILGFVWQISNDSSKVFNADTLACTKFTDAEGQQPARCIRREIVGHYKIAVSKNANACGFYFSAVDSAEPIFTPGRALTFIDNDNWSCESVAGTNQTYVRAVRQNGDLSMYNVDRELGVSLWKIDAEPADGPINAVKHWYRVAKQYLDKKT